MNDNGESSAQAGRSRKRRRAIWILAVAVLACGVLTVAGILIVQSVLRGGAASPREAVENLVESLSTKNLAGIYAMVAPEERDALQRVDQATVSRIAGLGITDAIGATSKGAGSSGDALSGLSVAISGVQPRIVKLSADVAAATITTGTARWSVDPTKTSGLIRAQLDAVHVTKRLNGSLAFASVDSGHGLTLMETKSGGRWYVSLLLTGLDLANSGTPRGRLPATTSLGSKSPQQAAEAAVHAVPTIARDGLVALAPHLAGEEALAAYLYGDSSSWLSDVAQSVKVNIDDVAFTSGPQDGDRRLAFLRALTFRPGHNAHDTVSLSSTCAVRGKKPKLCLNGSGYFGASSGNGALSLLADHGKFALTTMRENNTWKVSLIDTVADHVVWWADSLTRAQWIATLGLEQGEKEDGTLIVGKKTAITFNSAGYSVKKLVVLDGMKLQISDDTRGIIYGAHGRYITELRPGYATDTVVRAGSYKLVLVAGPRWADAFSDQGNKLHYSTDLKVSAFSVKRPTIDYDTAPKSSSITTSNQAADAVIDVQVPDGNKVNLVLTVTGVVGDGLGEGLFVAVDDAQDGIGVAAVAGTKTIIPLPADSDSHAIHVWVPGTTEHNQVNFTLSFEPQQRVQQSTVFVWR